MPTVLNIPIVKGGGAFRETLELDGEEYIFDFSYNQRDTSESHSTGTWYVSIFKNGDIIALRLRIVAGYNLLDAIVSLDKPGGFLYLYDVDFKTSVGNEADIDTLGDRILLVYEPADG